mmetsp:Transcript_49090/g.154223  ORF Transcript_49090/g.154223 Transcript_49090/m.154223 type:complete len:319 (+) Transcript_49090:63-1019(+)
MPLYEEKLINPLAVRFSQDRIWQDFQDGTRIEDSLAQIRTVPLTGAPYDLVLRPPFPPVEIIRLRQERREADGERSRDEKGRRLFGEESWFTFDNRRLYCLQRAAAELWPQRVAAVVQVMYASNPHALRRKFDTANQGRAVTVCRHVHGDEAPLFSWNWRLSVSDDIQAAADEAVRAARRAVTADERKARVEQLQDAPTTSSVGTPTVLRAIGNTALERLEAQMALEAQLAREAAAAAQGPEFAPAAPTAAPGAPDASTAGGLRRGRRRAPRRGGRRGEDAGKAPVAAAAPQPAQPCGKPTRAAAKQPKRGQAGHAAA